MEDRKVTPRDSKCLEAGSVITGTLLKSNLDWIWIKLPGAGAAGGLGTALMVFLNGTLKSGIETVLDLVDFDEHLKDVDIVVTGEGATDWQSVFGKVMQGVGVHCKDHHIPAVAIVGSMGKGAEDIYAYGIESIITTVNGIMPLSDALEHAEDLYLGAARRLFKLLKAGMQISKA